MLVTKLLTTRAPRCLSICASQRSIFTSPSPTNNPQKFINEVEQVCKPTSVHICDGSEEEFNSFTKEMMATGTVIPIKRPGSFLARSDPSDVARVEKQTVICSQEQGDAGESNNWRQPSEMKRELKGLFDGCMKGRKMYVIPFSMGPVGTPHSLLGLQVTDSPYVAASMKIMSDMGAEAWKEMENNEFVPCIHSVGAPLESGQEDVAWPCNKTKWITHFPETREIISFGSGYGGNALLGKKCLALRMASVIGRDEGWLAEHMLILSLKNKNTGEKKYIAAAFPSACGKTNLAMLLPSLPNWEVKIIGDDIAWIYQKEDGSLHAINPERGIFGVAPGTSRKTNRLAMEMVEKNTIFTNVALTPGLDVYWEGMDEVPERATNWQGKDWTPNSDFKAAHPNARFCAPISQVPSFEPDYNPVPLSAIIFGGRRSTTVPLVYEAFNWEHGVFMGASMASEGTSAAETVVGQVRRDPFAMLPFCGYNMGDYFQHWLNVGKKGTPETLPKIFTCNWFRKDENGKFIWPGFSENIRVLEWIFDRCDGKDIGVQTPIGIVPKERSINLDGIDMNQSTLNDLLKVDKESWSTELKNTEEYFDKFQRFPKELKSQLNDLKSSLNQ